MITSGNIAIDQISHLLRSGDFHTQRCARRALYAPSRLLRKINRGRCADILNKGEGKKKS